VTIHLVHQSAVDFEANDCGHSRWAPARTLFAGEIARWLDSDGYLGLRPNAGSIIMIPLGAVKWLDFTVRAMT
jgi:hypothetical protein